MNVELRALDWAAGIRQATRRADRRRAIRRGMRNELRPPDAAQVLDQPARDQLVANLAQLWAENQEVVPAPALAAMRHRERSRKPATWVDGAARGREGRDRKQGARGGRRRAEDRLRGARREGRAVESISRPRGERPVGPTTLWHAREGGEPQACGTALSSSPPAARCRGRRGCRRGFQFHLELHAAQLNHVTRR